MTSQQILPFLLEHDEVMGEASVEANLHGIVISEALADFLMMVRSEQGAVAPFDRTSV
jgi:hypothetical protein